MLIHHYIARANHCKKQKIVRWRFCQMIEFSKASSTRTQKSENNKNLKKQRTHESNKSITLLGSWQKAKESTSRGMMRKFPLLWIFKVCDSRASVFTPLVFFHPRRTARSCLYKTRRVSPHLSTHVSEPSTTVGSSPCRANAGLRNLATKAHSL